MVTDSQLTFCASLPSREHNRFDRAVAIAEGALARLAVAHFVLLQLRFFPPLIQSRESLIEKRKLGFAAPEVPVPVPVPVICLGGKVYGWTLPETEAPMLLAHQVRHIWRKPTAKPWATKSGWPIGDRRNRSLMPARS